MPRIHLLNYKDLQLSGWFEWDRKIKTGETLSFMKEESPVVRSFIEPIYPIELI
jgi:hypothetical protein